MEVTKSSGDEGSSCAAFNAMSSCRSPDATDAARVLCTLSAISALDAPPKAASRTDTSTLTVMDVSRSRRRRASESAHACSANATSPTSVEASALLTAASSLSPLLF